MRFGRLLLPSKVELRAIGGPIRIGGDLIITPGGGYTGNDAFVASTFVAGSIDIMTSDPIRGFFRKSDLHMVGSEVATLEVASQDIGIRQNPLHEFVFGTLTLGSDAGPAYVRLVDLHNNAPLLSPEALYLRGAVDGTANTLSLLNGSTLEIGNFSVYARLNGAWTDLHSLFPPGVDLIAYQDGFLFIPSPGSWIPVGLAALYVSRRRRVAGP
jgi:hypothetical protein